MNNNKFLTFDALELRDKIIDKLNESQVFTDQNYAGSNLSSIIDIISLSFGTLLFYLSKTSSEAMFSDAQLYENMNRIVKILNYNPTGKSSQSVPFNMTASTNLTPGVYTIPRYSYVNVGGSTFTLVQDIGFTKTTTDIEYISDLNHNYLLKEGSMQEYPLYTAMGIENEIVYISTADDIAIDHFGIDVYVQKAGAAWEKYERVDDISLHLGSSSVCEIRYNSNKRYEIMFGDNINGKKLQKNDSVAIYFLKITPTSPSIGISALATKTLIPFNSDQFSTILSQTKFSFGTYLGSNLRYLELNNSYSSSPYSEEESVESIRNKAPKVFRGQHRLITSQDYEFFVKNNFSNILRDSKLSDNDTYIGTHLKYLYNIGLDKPQYENQILFNQIKFANSCNFNNVYIYCVPKNSQKYLISSQKEIILKEISKYKGIGTHIVPMDPEYIYFDFYLKNTSSDPSLYDISQSVLRIVKTEQARRSNASIKFDIVNIISSYFNQAVLGYDINTTQLATSILAVDGVKSLQTYRKDTDISINEISFLVWNSKYPDNDMNVRTQTVYIDDFKFPLLYSSEYLNNRIEIIDASLSIKSADF